MFTTKPLMLEMSSAANKNQTRYICMVKGLINFNLKTNLPGDMSIPLKKILVCDKKWL